MMNIWSVPICKNVFSLCFNGFGLSANLSVIITNRWLYLVFKGTEEETKIKVCKL